jgi:O-antigen ligase
MRAEAMPVVPARAGARVTARAASAAPRALATPAERAPALVRWAFLLYAFSIPFESPVRILPYDVPTIVGALFLATTALAPRLCYGRAPAALWWFVAYLYAFGVAFALGGGAYAVQVQDQFVKLLQLVLIFWVGINLMREPGMAERMLLALAAAAIVLGLLGLTGVANTQVMMDDGVRRAAVLGQNPNRTSRLLGTGVLALAGLAYARPRAAVRPLLVWPLVVLLAGAMLRGGSRGGLLAMTAGFCVFTLAGASLAARVRNLLAVALGLSLMVGAALQSPLMRQRLEMARSGNLAKREEIFPTAWGMFRERPLTGWGPTANYYENASRMPMRGFESRDTHNLVLELLTSTGLLGTVPFLIGLGVAGAAAWRARTGPQGMLPAAFVAALLVGNMSGNFLWFKVYWLVLSYACAAQPAARPPRWGAP